MSEITLLCPVRLGPVRLGPPVSAGIFAAGPGGIAARLFRERADSGAARPDLPSPLVALREQRAQTRDQE